MAPCNYQHYKKGAKYTCTANEGVFIYYMNHFLKGIMVLTIKDPFSDCFPMIQFMASFRTFWDM
jgi:hypothetical protein